MNTLIYDAKCQLKYNLLNNKLKNRNFQQKKATFLISLPNYLSCGKILNEVVIIHENETNEVVIIHENETFFVLCNQFTY